MADRARLNKVLAGAALVAALIVVLASTGPRPSVEISGSVPRLGGVCLELERWDLFGWNIVGQTHSVADAQTGLWHQAMDTPPCAAVPKQIYRVRMPIDAAYDVYRLCGLADDQPCLEFRRVPFEGTPGP